MSTGLSSLSASLVGDKETMGGLLEEQAAALTSHSSQLSQEATLVVVPQQAALSQASSAHSAVEKAVVRPSYVRGCYGAAVAAEWVAVCDAEWLWGLLSGCVACGMAC